MQKILHFADKNTLFAYNINFSHACACVCENFFVTLHAQNKYPMLRRVQKYIQDKQLLHTGERVLVCVSGGADSVALLDVLYRAGYSCVVAHCNFHLRGEESNHDEAFVRQVVSEIAARRRYGDKDIPLYVQHFDTEAYARETGKSIEMAARELRYRWFFQLAEETGCAAVAVAHHQNDQAETVLLNLRRSPGLRGLQGMRPKAYTMSETIPVIRPLLCTTRDYIRHYLRDIRQIGWVEDSTNGDTRFKRNAVRAMLAEWSKAEIEHVAETAEMVQGYVDMLDGIPSPEAEAVRKWEDSLH